MLYRIEKPHAKDCPCAADKPPTDRHGGFDYYTPTVDGQHIKVLLRDARGRDTQHARRLWMRMECNEPRCPAVLLVNLEEIERTVSATVRQEKGKK